MNTRTLIAAAALALTATGGAFAQEATIEPALSFAQSTVSRTDVMAEARQALLRGDLHEVAQINAGTSFDGMLTRDTVRQATLTALANGEARRIDAEAYPFNGQREMRDASHFRVAGLAR